MSESQPEAISQLIERILDLTKSPQSIPYYRKAIATLGEGVVEMELGELRYQMKLGEVEDPARYFTKLIENQMSEAETGKHEPANAQCAPKRPGSPANQRQSRDPQTIVNSPPAMDPAEDKETYLSPSALELFEELRSPHAGGEETPEETALAFPYSNKNIPWATFVGPDFFTLSSNKSKSDQVMARFWLMNGEQTRVPLLRGKYSPDGESFGILTAEEGRILGALESIWVDQGCRYAKFEDESVMCFCKAPVRDVARLLGWETFGGSNLKFLKRKIIYLKTKPYYLDLSAVEEFRKIGLKGYGFSLVDAIELVDRKKHNREHTILFIQFSRAYSKQLVLRRVVSRPKEILQMRNELAFLLRLYLEPILMSRGKGGDHAIELLKLIQVLNLPAAGWHKYKSQRRFVFTKAMDELSGMRTTNGLMMHLTIEQGSNPKDFMMVARLITNDAKEIHAAIS